MKFYKNFYFFLFLLLINFNICAEDTKNIRIGTLQYGSVNWELEIIKSLNLDTKNDIKVEVVKLASKNAAAVALQGEAVDLIVTDWFWVSRQRSMNRMFSFVPHSMAVGGLITNKKSMIKSVEDLKNKKIGVAGGQVDKSWLIFRAYYKQILGVDLIDESKPIFGAPPLLNKKIEQGSFDAILTYWPYQARLLSKGFIKAFDIKDIIKELGVPEGMPIIGWVFKEKWAKKNKELFNKFLKTSNEAKKRMLESEDVWEIIKPIMKAENEKVFQNLKEVYKQGIPKKFSPDQIDGARKLYKELAKIGGKELVGNASELVNGTFWIK